MVFVLYFPIVIPCLLQHVLTFNAYTKQVLVLMLIFSIPAVILFGFCFRLDVFTSMISSITLSISYFSLLLLVAFLLEHNEDAKNSRNTDVRIHVKLKMEVPIETFLDHSSQK